VKLAIDLDAVVGDTRRLWEAWLDDAARRFRTIAPLEPASLPRDRGEAAEALDRWAAAGVGDWRGALERFAADHAPLYLRPDPQVNAALRALAARGATLIAFTDAPDTLARLAVAQLGAARALEALESASGALGRALERLGDGAVVVGSREELLRLPL